jgi:hypothetical protein
MGKVAQTIFPGFLLVNKCSKKLSKGTGASGPVDLRKSFIARCAGIAGNT